MRLQPQPARPKWPIAILVFSVLFPLVHTPLYAQPATSASGSAYGASVDLSLLPLLGSGVEIRVPSLPDVAADGSAGFFEQDEVLDLHVGTGATGDILSSGTVEVLTQSALPSTDQVSSRATVENALLQIVELLRLVSLSADLVEAGVTIDGTCGEDLQVDAYSRLVGAELATLGLDLPIALEPAPNSVLLDTLGIKVVLNRQTVTGNSTDGFTAAVDAIVVSVEDSLLAALGTLDGVIVIGHAEASLACGESDGGGESAADLSATAVAAPAQYEAGERLDFHFRIANSGPDTASQTQVVAELSEELSLISARLDGAPCTLTPPEARCASMDLAAGGAASFEVQAEGRGRDLASVTASVSSATGDPDPTDNQAEVLVEPRVTGAEPTADLSVTLVSSPDDVPVGDIGRFVVEITNRGPDPADVTVHCTIPERAELVAADLEEGSCQPIDGGGAVRCQLAPLPAGETSRLVLEGRALIPGLAASTLTVGSPLADPDSSNNSVLLATWILEPDIVGGDGGAEPTEALATACRLGVQPAATLLVPWFEVDLGSAQGPTTLIAVTNTDSAPRLARVTLWTDWAVPTTSFDLYLTGFDVTTLNLRDVFVGQLPGTGSEESPHGVLSGGATAFEGCTTHDLATDLTPARAAHVRSRHLGEPSPIDSLCAASPRSGAHRQLATGYVTVDVVRRCSDLTPADPGYFGESGVASNANVLMGEVLYVGPGDDSAQGETAVHLVADPFTFRRGDNTFYGRYSRGDDARQPLPSRWATRFMAGGPFSGGTELIVWRDTGSPDAEPVGCGTGPSWGPLSDRGVSYFDEEENPGELGGSTERFPWATGKVAIGSGSLAVEPAFGWMILDFRGSPIERAVQTFVAPVMSASGRYSISFGAAQLDTGCP